MFAIFIKRPVLSLVISLFLVLLGVISLLKLPVTQFPDIVPPSVTVTANYTGASAEVCANAVAIPLERAINGVSGMTYMSTVTSNNGTTLIQVFFKVGTDPDMAAVNVQNRISTVLDELPEEVIKAGVTTEKEVNSMLMYLNVMSTDTNADEKFIFNFADINIIKELKRIEGVGFAEIMGAQDYSMRVWLKPDRLHAYNLSVSEVVDAVKGQNVEISPGKAGESSGKKAQELQYVLRYSGKYNKPEQYENIIIRAENDGSYLRLKDVADIEFGSLSYSMVSKTDGRPSASIMMKQRPGSNAKEVIANVKKRMAELKESSFPPGMDYTISYDVSRFLDASIHEVVRTLIEAFILVFIIVYLFLQDFRSVLIPALAVPVAIVGTFFFMQVFDFSLNLMTLFALVLSIGIVVDDAIVVVEAVHSKMSQEHIGAREATLSSMKDISGAILAITLVMSAVFVPVAFMEGPVGIFYKQFSITLAIAIVISGVNALTLTPALCALLLKHNAHPEKTSLLGRFFNKFNAGYDKLQFRYKSTLLKVTGRRTVILAILGVFIVGIWGVNTILPTGFIPQEDQGMIYVNVTTPAGATLERTEQVLDEIQKKASKIEGVETISTLAGYSLMSEVAGASYGMGMINLKKWDERKSYTEIIELLTEKCKDISDASVQFFAPPTVPGFGNASGFEMRVLNKTGNPDIAKTATVTNELIAALNKSGYVTNAVTGFNPYFPQYNLIVDHEMAAKKGVDVYTALSTLKAMLGSSYISNFIRFGQMYKVMIQASPEYRSKPEDILNMYVKGKSGEMVPYATFIKLDKIYGPEQLTRYNMYLAAMVTGEAANGKSSGEVIEKIKSITKDVLPKGYTTEWSGMTREQVLAGGQTVVIFIVCLLFVYLILSAQYESFLLPLPVILSLPTGIFGSYLTLQLAGLENNIYAQVALIMLIGLLGKNAILIIEYAEILRRRGYNILNAAIESAQQRLRPILMTSLAFVAGLIPLCLAHGAGAAGNKSIGFAAAGGMLSGTVFGLVIIPGLYLIFANMQERFKKTPKEKNIKHHVETIQ